jgi:membrane protein required for colicin V production
MILDIIFAVLIGLAIFRGYQRGLVAGVFSLVAIIIGLAAALKLSAAVAGYIGQAVRVSDRWLPIISFIVVFLLVLWLIRLGARLIQKTMEMAALGWINRLGGILLYAVVFIIVYSILLFYAGQVRLLQPDTIERSVTYSFVQPWGPKVINGFGNLIPFFKDMFGELESFFDGVAKKLP